MEAHVYVLGQHNVAGDDVLILGEADARTPLLPLLCVRIQGERQRGACEIQREGKDRRKRSAGWPHRAQRAKSKTENMRERRTRCGGRTEKTIDAARLGLTSSVSITSSARFFASDLPRRIGSRLCVKAFRQCRREFANTTRVQHITTEQRREIRQ